MNEKLLEVKNLTVEYKTDLETVQAVNDISFMLNKGETLGIVGETGAGKTTTALSIMRLLPERTGIIRSGCINMEGKDLLLLTEHDMRKIRGERVAMIFQDPMTSLNPVLTIGLQIGEAIELHNDDMTKKKIEARVDDVLSLVGIPCDRKKDYPHQFSGGMKQRVVIAIALACNPSLVIADEPTTALDVTIQAQVLNMMCDLQDNLQMGMIMITHDLGIVAQTCDHVAVMYAGRIIEHGTAEDIFLGEAHHPYTIGLFGSIPNLNEKTKRLNPISGLMPDPTNLPAGCEFAPRCLYRTERCDCEKPMEQISGTHAIRCVLFEGYKKERDIHD